MQEHLKASYLLAGYGFTVHVSAPPGILEIAGDDKLKRVTTTAFENGRRRRYYVMPVISQPAGWKIIRIEVTCAVCKGRGMNEHSAPCHYCGATGWVPLDDTERITKSTLSNAHN